MNIKHHISKIVALSIITSTLHGASLSPHLSLIAAPRLQDTIIVRGPVVMGIVTDATGKALKNKTVILYVDKRKVAIVPTNKYGVWSYILNETQFLQDSAHIVEACVTLSSTNAVWTQATLFYVNTSHQRIG